jgi:acyl carrier protein
MGVRVTHPADDRSPLQALVEVAMDEAVFEEVRALVAEQLPDVDKSSITLASSFEDDLRADSLALVELLMAIEEKFDLPDIPEEDADKIKTVGDVVSYIESRKAN